jgi:hypothetical protein
MKRGVNVAPAMGYRQNMGREQNEPAQPPSAPEEDTDGAEVIHGMGLSSEHDEGEVQEVDSREQH